MNGCQMCTLTFLWMNNKTFRSYRFLERANLGQDKKLV